MFKKNFNYVLAFAVSVVLSIVFYLFVSNIEKPEAEKSKIQLTAENAAHRWNDLFYKAQSDKKPNESVVLLAVDETAVTEVGRWPWSRTIIAQITDNLLKYDIKTLAFDIIFSEKETDEIDKQLIDVIAKAPEKITLGTFSDSQYSTPHAYQDYCTTQAFLYTGGDSLVKVNPFFVVEDESDACEAVEFNKVLYPVFKDVEKDAEESYLKYLKIAKLEQLTKYQTNTLNTYKRRKVYEYCSSWLVDDKVDYYHYNIQKNLRPLYFNIFKDAFKIKDESELEGKATICKKAALPISIPQYILWTQNIKQLQDAAQYTANFISTPDNDGIIRNYPLVLRVGNKLGTSYIPSLAIQSYLNATGYQAIFKVEQKKLAKVVTGVEISDQSGDKPVTVASIPVNSEGKMLVGYYGKQKSLPHIPASELLNNNETLKYSYWTYENGVATAHDEEVSKKDFLKGKNIIFGATAIGIYDIRNTPNDINYPGPEIHATVLSNLLNKEYLSYGKYELENAPYIFFVAILIFSLIFMVTGIRTSSITLVSTIVVFIILQNYLFIKGRMFHSSFVFLNFLFASFFVSLVYKYFFQSRRSKEMKSAFSKYVSKDVVNEILQNESAIELRGQKLMMSVYFSDIRGFTEFSEKMDPVELSELLNRYFTPMSQVINEHQGTIDKYIGDAIMAMFGAPINYKDHAYQACMAALGCIKVLGKINEEFKLKNWPVINIGIGINSGYMNAGNIGSATIQNYTVIGDSVNLASRLEGLNKNYGTQIIISQYTYEEVKDRFICRELDKVNVKGKKEPVTIYELICTR